ncbi:MAG: hypothetical protein A2096_04365 [Spirochaetes bacterium GWF1_41_5]|nr:MAG: hypothetical protein A2096_04365 [Spirochaetes bacterium GWF1_41_5]HBE04270.1 hypothetical protein [Spirochaetia bacterium]
MISFLFFVFQILAETADNIIRETGKIFRREQHMKPLMKKRERDVLIGLLKIMKPEKVLEWGCGYSTLYYPGYLKKNAAWLAIEHNAGWAQKIIPLNKDPRVVIKLLPPENTEWADKSRDGTADDFRAYISHPREKYDFIIIDGRARMDCLSHCRTILNGGGIILLHDANRDEYAAGFSLFPKFILLRDYRHDKGGFAAFGRDLSDPVMNFLNLQKKIFGFYGPTLAAFFRQFHHEI